MRTTMTGIVTVLALAAGAIPAAAGQRFTDDFTVPTANWRGD